MEIVSPSIKYKNSYIQYIKELGDETRYPFTLDFDYEDFNALLIRLDEYENGINLPEENVPSTTLWMVEGQELIGVTNIRHCLNSRIEHCGGHIGLGIRPSCRGQKLGQLLMKSSIEKLREMGTQHVHIHCYKANSASAYTIINNGGELESELALGEETVQRYVVKYT
ncbi:MAG: GNAT family N-acetyltransferase [Psychromonas sp.]